jgi:hypothetical protein
VFRVGESEEVHLSDENDLVRYHSLPIPQSRH